MSYIGKIPANAVLTTADLADGIVTAAKIEDGTVVAAEIASNAVTTAKINADAVTGAKIADDAINSEHYTDGSIDTAHIADVNVTQGKIADQAINEAKMQISNAPTNGYMLTAQSGNTGGLTWAAAGGGKIGQVIYGSTTSAYNSNSTSYTNTGLTAAITPSATSSKVVVLVSQAGDFVNGDNNGTNRVSYMALYRGSGEIAGQKQSCQYQFAGYNVPISFSFSVLDAPSTTNETTYKTMCKIDNAVEQHINLQQGTSRSQMILMEVLA